MNSHSLLCAYLSVHPDWEARLPEEYHLKIRREGPYAIFNYGYDANFALSLVQEARGIILDTERLEVVCWPFRKFGNYTESYADPIDWSTACVQEKVDGSIVKLWYAAREGRWMFSTNGMIDAAQAPIETLGNGRTFLDSIRSARNYKDLHPEALDTDKTYIFELVSPETRVVVAYERAMLYHIGTRHNRTGVETDEDIGIQRPARYPLQSLEDCLAAARALNRNQTQVQHEGFVVVDAHWHRVKIKSPEYLVRHQITSIVLSAENCLNLLLNSGYDLTQLCEMRAPEAGVLRCYAWQLEELLCWADRTAELARAMYEEYSHDRKAVAIALKRSPLAFIGFAALESDVPGRELLLRQNLSRVKKLMVPYEQVRERVFPRMNQ